jgi:uncharacterized membrane protein
MAGIGFTLRRVLERRSLSRKAEAFGAGALVSCGPWLLSVLTLALIGVLARGSVARSEVNLFFAIITNIFAFSLILTGPLQLIVTRYIADLVYLRRHTQVVPSLLGALLLTSAALYTIGLPFVLRLELEPSIWIGMLALFAVVGGIWITMLFISATRRYDRIFIAFAVGSVVSLVAAWLGGRTLGVPGLVWGYLCGQGILLYSLVTVIAIEFPRGRGLSFAFLGHFRLHPRLALVGLFYNLAIWVDKLLFWHHPDTGVSLRLFLHTSPVYDLPAYLAYLSIVPGMAFFTVRIETDLADAYARYFDRVLERGTLGEIRAVKHEIAHILGDGARRLLRIQGLVCLTLILLAPGLVRLLGLDWVHLPVLRVHLLAVLPQMLIVVAITTLYYFDSQRDSLILSATFVLTNLLATSASLALGPSWYGYGWVTAGAITAAVGLLRANRVVADMDFVTFTRQPIELAREIGERATGATDAGDAESTDRAA